MAHDGTVKIGTEIDKSGLKSGLSDIGNYAKKGFGVLGSTAKAAAGLAISSIAGVTAALGGAAATGISYNSTMETYLASFETMTGSAEKALAVTEKLKDLGASTPFEMADLAETTQLLMNYGFTADDAIDKMAMLGDISQGSADKMGRVAAAYGQMSSAGKVSLEDVKQMIEAGFNPLQEISDSTGESMASLYDRISKGTISVDEITASMQRATSEGGKYYQSMEKQSKTMEGQMSTLKDNALALAGEVVQPVCEEISNNLLPSAIEAIEQLSTSFQTDGAEGLVQAGMSILNNILLGITQAAPGIIDTAISVISQFIANLNENLSLILSAGGQILMSLVNGILLLLPQLGSLAWNLVQQIASGINANLSLISQQGSSLFSSLSNAIKTKLPEMFSNGCELAGNLLNGLLQKAPHLLSTAGEIIVQLVGSIMSALPRFLDSGSKLLEKLIQGIVQNGPSLLVSAGKVLIDLVKKIGEHLPEFLQKGIEVIGRLIAGIIRAVPDLVKQIPGIIKQLKEKFDETDWLKIGKNIIKGIAKGITNAAGDVLDALGDVVGDAIDGVKEWLGIHSPSRLMRDLIGKNMVAGINVGIVEEQPELEKQSKKTVEAAVNSMQRASEFVPAMQEKAYSVVVDGMENENAQNVGENNPHDRDPEPIDYERFGEEVSKSMEGMTVEMDGRTVGKVVAPTVNDEIGKINRRKT